jgi:hypothetical protein
MLRHGPKPGTDLKSLAKADGIPERTLLRAKSHLGLISYRAGIGASGKWMWQWPKDRRLPPGPAMPPTPNV